MAELTSVRAVKRACRQGLRPDERPVVWARLLQLLTDKSSEARRALYKAALTGALGADRKLPPTEEVRLCDVRRCGRRRRRCLCRCRPAALPPALLLLFTCACRQIPTFGGDPPPSTPMKRVYCALYHQVHADFAPQVQFAAEMLITHLSEADAFCFLLHMLQVSKRDRFYFPLCHEGDLAFVLAFKVRPMRARAADAPHARACDAGHGAQARGLRHHASAGLHCPARRVSVCAVVPHAVSGLLAALGACGCPRTAPWLLTGGAQEAFSVFDCFLVEGFKILLRFGMALLAHCKDVIVAAKTPDEVWPVRARTRSLAP